jgi:predicted nucleic acid-binding protein
MRYFDASALCKWYIEEPESQTVRHLLDAPAATSRLSSVEVASGVIRRAREEGMPAHERDRVLDGFARDQDNLLIVELTPVVTALATGILARNALRAPDAIHLASCLWLRDELGADIPFVAFDARLRAAALAEDLLVEP